MNSVAKYFRDSVAELRHVKWPTSTQAAAYTVLVVAVSAVVALLLSGFDYIFSRLLESII